MNLADIFSDTKKFYTTNKDLVSACEYSRQNQKFVAADEKISCNRLRFSTAANIVISKKRTFEAAEQYAKKGERVCVLNFANSYQPGGGVVEGARAQEECLCRVSTLYNAIATKEMYEAFYLPHIEASDDLANDDIIFTPKVTVFKSDTSEPALRPESEWFYADVITCAAPCLYRNESLGGDMLFNLHESRARHILDVACKNNADTVILGAFGCGAFFNPPEIVASAYKNVISDYSKAFKTIEFAIFCTDKESFNYTVFKSILNQ